MQLGDFKVIVCNMVSAGDLERTVSAGWVGWKSAWNGPERDWELRKRRPLVQVWLSGSVAGKGAGRECSPEQDVAFLIIGKICWVPPADRNCAAKREKVGEEGKRTGEGRGGRGGRGLGPESRGQTFGRKDRRRRAPPVDVVREDVKHPTLLHPWPA